MEEIKELAKAVQELSRQQEEISTVLSGNERYGIPGMKHILQETRDEVKELKTQAKGELRRIFKWMAISAAVSSIFTVGAIKLGIGKLIAVFIKLLGL
jgi:uncharacterized protein YegL